MSTTDLDLDLRPDDEPDDADRADVVPFVLGHAPAASGRTLEVHQAWGNTLLATKQFAPGHGAVRIGLETGQQWRFLGIDMGFVPRPVSAVLPWVAPLWSEVEGGWRSDFVVDADALPDGRAFTLFEVGPSGAVVAHVATGWDGFVERDGERLSFPALAERGLATRTDAGLSIPLGDGMRLVVEAAGSVFFAHRVAPALRVGSRGAEEPDRLFAGAVGLGASVFVAVLALMWVSPPTHTAAAREIPPQLVELLLDSPAPREAVAEARPKGDEPGAKPRAREGKAGRRDGEEDRAKRQTKRLQLDRQTADHAGVLGALNDGRLDAVLGSSALSSDLQSGVGGLIGSAGTQLGTGGLAGRGDGLGGGGDADSLGGIDTHGPGSGRDYGVPGGGGPKPEGELGGAPREVVVLGQLDRSLIDEVVKRNTQALRYCYQRELNKSPGLGGKVVMKFTISGDGSVSSAAPRSSTLGNAAVEKCMADRFLHMTFPTPKAGGTVVVSYPFLFSQG